MKANEMMMNQTTSQKDMTHPFVARRFGRARGEPPTVGGNGANGRRANDAGITRLG